MSFFPLIHNITNYVTMDFSANALLALGASPVMAHAKEEVEEMTAASAALVLNIGTLSPYWVEGMEVALQSAQKKGIPVVFDPVGCGATRYRTETSKKFLNQGLTVIKGNASEIVSLCKKEDEEKIKTKGVDNVLESEWVESQIPKLQALAYKKKVILAITGPQDYVLNEKHIFVVKNGHSMMSKVTGMGCVLSSFVASFCSINPDSLFATLNALTFFGIVGEIAAKKTHALASFKMEFLNAVKNISDQDIVSALRISKFN